MTNTEDNASGGTEKSDCSNATHKRKEPSRQEKVAKLEQEEMRSEQMRMVKAGEKLAKLEQKEMRREQMRASAGRGHIRAILYL